MHFVGYRFSDRTHVTVVGANGDPEDLPLRLDLWNHSPTGFEWGYLGSGPAQLALAILAQVTGDDIYARARHQQFKEQVVARWVGRSWDISAEEVQAWAASHPLPQEERLRWLPRPEQKAWL